MRLDQALVERGLVETRSKASQLIREKQVKVGGRIVDKASYAVGDGDDLSVQTEPYVGRAALKLKGFLDAGDLAVTGMAVLDIGASTGGFAEVLLEHGAARVVCVDVGEGQLHPRIAADPRVENVEKCDIRTFERAETFDLVTVDVSFISVGLIMDAIDRYAAREIIILFKPQFEVGRDAKRSKSGVVTDNAAVRNAMQAFERRCAQQGWQIVESREAVITGKEGNSEYVYRYRKIND